MPRLHFEILTIDWSDSPAHSGQYRLFLSDDRKGQRWVLSADNNPTKKRLPFRKGRPDEDPRTVAVELLKKAVDRHALIIDDICDNGPFDIDISDFVEPI